MKRIKRWAIATSVLAGGVLVLGNGRDPYLWAYLVVFASVGLYAMFSMDDDLVRERFSPPSAGADRVSLGFVRMVALAHLLIGVADSRYGWTHVSGPLRVVGIAGFAVCFVTIARAARANRFFSSVVRIQTDTGSWTPARMPEFGILDTQECYRSCNSVRWPSGHGSPSLRPLRTRH